MARAVPLCMNIVLSNDNYDFSICGAYQYHRSLLARNTLKRIRRPLTRFWRNGNVYSMIDPEFHTPSTY